MKFSKLGLSEPFFRATEALGYDTTTPIQAEAIPVVLSGRDLIGCAQTGTGKTAAFTLPMLDRLLQSRPQAEDHRPVRRDDQRRRKGSSPKPRVLRALILAPTRELAAQIGVSLEKYGKFTPLRQTVIFGGVSQHHQVKALRHGVDALVATPGRLLDLMQQGYIDLSKVEILVFDEADQMLDMGFLPDLKRIVASVPKKRQTLMFSATMPSEIRELAQQWLKKPKAIQVNPVAKPADRIAQSVYLVDKKRKGDLLSRFLKETSQSRTLVFSRTKHGADKIVTRLRKDGIYAAAIHGNKSQNARSRALAQFKSNNPPVLVATDIAARGLDINQVSHVVNYDLPETPETYVHRIGRTARAGAEGVAVSFCAGSERRLLKQIEQLTKTSIPVEPSIRGFDLTDPNNDGRGESNSRNPSSRKRRRKPQRYSAKPDANRSHDDRSPQHIEADGSSTQRNKRKRPGRNASRVTASNGNGASGGAARKRKRKRATSR